MTTGMDRFTIDLLPAGCNVRVTINEGRVRFQAVDAKGKVYPPSDAYPMFEGADEKITIRWADLTRQHSASPTSPTPDSASPTPAGPD